MKTTIIILLSLLMIGCVPLIKKQIIPVDVSTILESVDKEISVKIKIKNNEQSLENVVSDLNGIYGDPIVEISAFRSDVGKIIVMKKLYYQIDGKTFVIVSIVNDKVLLIDTVHAPITNDNKGRK